MKLSDISIQNPVFAWMLMISLMLFGWIAYQDLGVSEMPEVDFPVISINVTWEGAAPEVVESDVADILEDAVMSVQGIRDISSVSRQGVAEITVEFELGRDIDVCLQDIQSKITQAQRRLPEDIDPPIIAKVNPTDSPIMWLGLSGSRPTREVMAYVQDTLKSRFQTIEGVGDIILGGFVERNLRVWVSLEKLDRYELTVADVVEAIERGHKELPAGRIETPAKELNIRVMGEAPTVEDFGEIILPRRAGLPVYKEIRLKEVAVIEDNLADVRRISRVMGETAVGLGIRKQRGANTVEIAHKVKAKLKEIQKELPQGMKLGINFDSTRFVEEAIAELIFTLVLSAALTSLVCWIFLGSWSSTVNVLLAIPTSVLGTFLAFKMFNFTLNTFTVLALSLAIGIVVDDAIMVLENITRYHEKGLGRVKAAAEGARQIAFAAFAATLALVAIFLPIAFMKGVIGKLFYQFGVAISVAVLLSFVEAMSLTPMRASRFMEPSGRKGWLESRMDAGMKNLAAAYGRVLQKSLKKPWLTVVAALLFFGVSLLLFGTLRKEFVPAQDQGFFLCRLKTPVGSSLEFTDSKFKEAEAFVMKVPEVQRYFTAVGGFGGGEINTGIIFVTLKPKKERPLREGQRRPLTQQELIGIFRKELNKIPDAQAFIQDLSTRGFTAQRGYPVEFSIRGPEWEKLAEYSEVLEKRLKETGLMVDVDSDYLSGTREVRVIPDRQKCIERGVEIRDMTEAVNALFGGVRTGKYTSNGRRYDVRVRLAAEDRLSEEDIKKVYVWNNRSERVRLGDVASIELKPALMSVTRKGRERAIGIFGNVAAGKSQADALSAVERIGREVLPEGYRVVLSGSATVFKESFQSLFFALGLGIIVAYMILASQFNSYLHPVSVLLALPFSISGALVALWVTGQSLNVFSMIGLILLMGIVKKNSILLVEFTNHVRREEGKNVRMALLEACPVRLRPILMTSVSTVAAAIPAALSLGPGSETRVPMAAAVIGGVIVSTLLSLFVVPCFYLILSKFEKPQFALPDAI